MHIYGIQKNGADEPICRAGTEAQMWRTKLNVCALGSDYTTKLQQSKQYGTGTKTDTQINGTEQRAQK